MFCWQSVKYFSPTHSVWFLRGAVMEIIQNSVTLWIKGHFLLIPVVLLTFKEIGSIRGRGGGGGGGGSIFFISLTVSTIIMMIGEIHFIIWRM